MEEIEKNIGKKRRKPVKHEVRKGEKREENRGSK